ncbi:MAG: replication-associated recombination protein A [bacterium]
MADQKSTNLFSEQAKKLKASAEPLAERMRPRTLLEFVGQEQIIAPGKMLRVAIETDRIPSIILWGPPGSGKTTLAKVIANHTKSAFSQLSAVLAGVKEIREAITEAESRLELTGVRTILFVDEIHRFNKSQQDALLPHVEKGVVTLIGATTENPSFEVNSALLSRARVFVLEMLSVLDIEAIIRSTLLDKERGLGSEPIQISEATIKFLASMSNGDARTALNTLELASKTSAVADGSIQIDERSVKEALQKTHLLYDKHGEEHYNIISALHKSMRGNDANAALYWLGRMLVGGEEPLYVARRLVRFASEDVGLADPQALILAVATYQACHFLGLPECELALAELAAYLAKAPKSNQLYTAYGQVKNDIQNLPAEPVPLHLRNAPTKMMSELGYGKGYKYTPDFKSADEAKQDYLPKSLKNRRYLA